MCLHIHIHTCIHVYLDRLADVQPMPPPMTFSKLFPKLEVQVRRSL